MNPCIGQIVSGTDSITFTTTFDNLGIELSSIEFIIGRPTSFTLFQFLKGDIYWLIMNPCIGHIANGLTW
jgi:hypothetical protein